jgi:hypothetical protein
MSRLSFLMLASLIFASPAFAESQTVTEQVVSFDAVVEAPAVAMSVRGDGAQRTTEAVASFEAPVRGAAFVASASGSGAQPATEQIAAFEAPLAPAAAAASTVTPARVAAHCEHCVKTCECG